MINYFDKVYCICLEDRPKKKAKLLEQLKHHLPEYKPEVFNAINTRHLENHHIGCALSHRSIIQEAKNKKYKNILGRTGFEPVTNGLKGHCSTN